MPDQTELPVRNRRADAQRNRARILEAVPAALRENPDASVADLAAAAGVGRMTLYGHFKTRGELIEAALIDALARGDQALAGISLDGDPADAFSRLVESSWAPLDQARGLLAAAQKELPAARIRGLHASAEERMRNLLERARQAGTFRTDLSTDWLLAVTHAVMNTAAAEVNTGRLHAADAPAYVETTLRSAFAPSGPTG